MSNLNLPPQTLTEIFLECPDVPRGLCGLGVKLNSMSFSDLQRFIRLLEDRQELVRIHQPVDRYLEITEIADRYVKKGGPALLFENVLDSDIPLAIGLMGTRERMALALGVSSLDQLAVDLRALLKFNIRDGVGGLVAQLPKAQALLHLKPKRVRSAPVQEVVWTGNDIDLYRLPILHSWPQDGGPFITLPLVITRDPETGDDNLGMYRMQVMGKNVTGMHWQRHKTGAKHLQKAKKLGKKLEVAVALGGDPALIYAATAPLPPLPGLSEYVLTGYLRKQRQPIVRGITVDLDVPANAEIILEGYVDPEEAWVDEGPFGDHTGFYTPVDRYPLFHVTAVTMRHSPVYPATIVGRPPMEDAYLIEASERLFLPAAQMVLPEIRDYHLPPVGVAHNLVVVAIKKEYPGHAYKVAQGLLGLGQMMFAKVIVVVDEGVPVDRLDVLLELLSKICVPRDVLKSRGPMDVLDHSSRAWGYGGKLIVDATQTWPEEEVLCSVCEPDRASAYTDGFEILKSEISGPYWYIALRKNRPFEGMLLGRHLAQAPEAKQVRHVVICDEWTDVSDPMDIWWTVLNNIDPERDVEWMQGKLIWDATPKLKEEGFDRVWPDKIKMSKRVQDRVDALWHLYTPRIK